MKKKNKKDPGCVSSALLRLVLFIFSPHTHLLKSIVMDLI